MVYSDVIYLFIGILFGILGFYMAGYAEKNKNTLFKIIYLILLVWTGIMIPVSGFEKTLLGAYLISIIFVIGFFVEKRIVRQLVSEVAIITMILEIAFCSSSPVYRSIDYAAAFKEGFSVMEEHYALTDYREVDFDALYDEYLPLFKEVDKQHDKVGNVILWRKFCEEFYDGHVGYMEQLSSEEERELGIRLFGNDYGLSLLRCSDGSVAAVNVTEEGSAYRCGIVNGTVITSWDGLPIEEFLANEELPMIEDIMPVKENERFVKTICAAGQGGEVLRIGYIDRDGNEKTTELSSNGAYYERMNRTLGLLFDGKFETNLTVTTLSESTAMIRVSAMGYDANSYGGGDYSQMYNELREKLQEQKDLGVTNLIFDLRSNTGGSPQFDSTIFSLILPEGEYTMSYNSVWDDSTKDYKKDETTGKYVVGTAVKTRGEGFWGDGKIVVLVNAKTVSAGDMFTEVMSRFDNVTIMGITPSNCSCQAVRGADIGKGFLSFSAVPNLKENGDIYIDCDKNREATVLLDKKVEINEELIDAIFNRGEDYILQQALDAIEE